MEVRLIVAAAVLIVSRDVAEVFRIVKHVA
jgi:hypothetical protein